MKKFLKCLLVAIILPIACVFASCGFEDNVSIKDISKTSSNGLVDTYTVTYTNGETTNFTIVNGEDGENLYTNITINDLYNQVKPSKPSNYELIDFINEYLDIQIDDNSIASAKALRSAVSIYVEHEIKITDYNNIVSVTETGFGKEYTYGLKNSITWNGGAGVIYKLDEATGDAYIITNYHVCFNASANAADGIATRFIVYPYGAESINLNNFYYLQQYNQNCKLYGSYFNYDQNGLPIIDYGYGAMQAEYIGGSEQYDIAVLKISGSDRLKSGDYLAAEAQNSDLVTAGSRAIAVGNPSGKGLAVTEGVISVDSEYIQVQIDQEPVSLRVFRVDTTINGGNSGGGLFDGFGRLIGIANAKTSDDTLENTAYAIPSNIATRVAESIIDMCDGATRKFNRLFVGVTLTIADSKGVYDEANGVMRVEEIVKVVSVENNSLALQLGLNEGDILESIEIINDKGTKTIEFDRMFQVIDAMLLVRENDSIKINYVRGGVKGSVTSTALSSNYFIEIN